MVQERFDGKVLIKTNSTQILDAKADNIIITANELV